MAAGDQTIDQNALAARALDAAREKGLRLATAESCTGGLIAGCLTEIPGSSDVFDCGFVSYSYEAKTAQLGVAQNTISHFGAVSEETALEMAGGALKASRADIAVAVTGIAGPGGATPGKPVGLVYIGVANGRTGAVTAARHHFSGDRGAVRRQTVEAALLAVLREIAAVGGAGAKTAAKER